MGVRRELTVFLNIVEHDYRPASRPRECSRITPPASIARAISRSTSTSTFRLSAVSSAREYHPLPARRSCTTASAFERPSRFSLCITDTTEGENLQHFCTGRSPLFSLPRLSSRSAVPRGPYGPQSQAANRKDATRSYASTVGLRLLDGILQSESRS
jgi:hypothetical protein